MFTVKAAKVKLASGRHAPQGCGVLGGRTAFPAGFVSAIQASCSVCRDSFALPMQGGVGPDKPVVGRGTGASTATAQIMGQIMGQIGEAMHGVT
jgi:hypothetical protein